MRIRIDLTLYEESYDPYDTRDDTGITDEAYEILITALTRVARDIYIRRSEE